MISFKKNKKGFGLIEIIIGSAVLLLVTLSVTSAYNTYINYFLTNQDNSKASYLLEEGLEAIIFLKDQNFTSNIKSLTSGSTYYLYFNGTSWTSTTTSQYVDSKFLRSFVVSNVNRDGSDKIATVGTNDPNTKLVTVSVSFPASHATTTKSLSTYITNIYNN
jgi:Tfp pilus assembly protein PilE